MKPGADQAQGIITRFFMPFVGNDQSGRPFKIDDAFKRDAMLGQIGGGFRIIPIIARHRRLHELKYAH